MPPVELLLPYFPLPFSLLSLHIFWTLEDIDKIGKVFIFTFLFSQLILTHLSKKIDTLNNYAEKYINNNTYKESTKEEENLKTNKQKTKNTNYTL